MFENHGFLTILKSPSPPQTGNRDARLFAAGVSENKTLGTKRSPVGSRLAGWRARTAEQHEAQAQGRASRTTARRFPGHSAEGEEVAQAHLGDPAGSVPDHRGDASITSQSKERFGFPVHMNVHTTPLSI